MNFWQHAALIAAGAAVLAGCAGPVAEGPAGQAPSLEGRSLMWSEGATSECEIPPTITFSKGRVSGNAGCNSFTGGYKLEGKKLALSNLAMTMRMCGPAFMDAEGKFTAALGKVRYATAEGDNVTLWDEAMKPVLRLEPEHPGRCN